MGSSLAGVLTTKGDMAPKQFRKRKGVEYIVNREVSSSVW